MVKTQGNYIVTGADGGIDQVQITAPRGREREARHVYFGNRIEFLAPAREGALK